MDLHTGVPIWRAINPGFPSFPQAQGDLNCEVAIIGGGITGSLLGYFFAREGVDALLIDQSQPSQGSTAASTGLLQFEIDAHLHTLIGKVGVESAVHAYRRGIQAIDELEQLVEQLKKPCGFSRRESLYFASHWWHIAAIKREAACRREHGLPVELLSREQLAEISSIRSSCTLRSPRDGQIDPYAFTNHLFVAAADAGLCIFGDSKVISAEELPGKCVISTAHAQIVSRAMVIATGYAAHELLQSQPGNFQSTYAVASAPMPNIPGWPNGSLLWESARPYFYGRLTDDGRAIIGGADTAFSDDHQRNGLVDQKVKALERRFHQLFPDAPFVAEYAWAGTFAETKDGLAYIGRPVGKSRTFAALGYGGNGITFAVIAARLIVDLFCGRSNHDEQVFSFER